MPFNPIHFEPSENGFLLVFKPSSLVINKPEYLLTCRGLLENELRDKGYEMTDGATAVDGSDAQVWFEYPPQTKRSDELIALHVLRAINRINRTIYKQFHVKDRVPLCENFFSIGRAPNPADNLTSIGDF